MLQLNSKVKIDSKQILGMNATNAMLTAQHLQDHHASDILNQQNKVLQKNSRSLAQLKEPPNFKQKFIQHSMSKPHDIRLAQ